MLANILDREVYTLHGSELSACIGAAKLGFLSIGEGAELLKGGMSVRARYQPMPEVQGALQVRYQRFRGLLTAAQGLRE